MKTQGQTIERILLLGLATRMALAVGDLDQPERGITLVPSALTLENLDAFCPGQDIPMPREGRLDLQGSVYGHTYYLLSD